METASGEQETIDGASDVARRPGVRLSVLEAQAIRYRLAYEGEGGNLQDRTNLLVSVTFGDENGELYRGQGEAPLRGSLSGDPRVSAQQVLSSIMEQVQGRSFVVSNVDSALATLRCLVEPAITSVLNGYPHQNGPDGTPRSAFSGVRFGIQSALVQALSAALNTKAERLLLPPDKRGEGASLNHLVLEPSVWMSKPESIVDVTGIHNLVREAIERGDKALWVDARKRLSVNRAQRWFTIACKEVERLGADLDLKLYRPLRASDEHRYSELIGALAREFGESLGTKIEVVLPSDLLTSAEKVPNCAGLSIAILPFSYGGLFEAVDDFAHRIQNLQLPVYLLGMTAPSSVGRADLERLAMAVPGARGAVFPEYTAGIKKCSEELPLDDATWGSLLADKYTRLTSSSKEHWDPLDEPANYFPEEKYIAPIGPYAAKRRLFQKASLLLGFDTIQYSKSAFMIVDRAKKTLMFHGSATPLNSAAAKSICNDKEATRLLLQRHDVPVPSGRVFNNGDFDLARLYAEQLGFPVVVKPAMGTMGIGVMANIRDANELELAFKHFKESRLSNQDFIVEKHIYGEEYRILVIDREVVAAVRREPASVIGDGVHSIAELILRKNRYRRLNPQLASSPIIYSPDTKALLRERGYNLSSIPKVGDRVLLSSSSNISVGGDSREMSDLLHPTVIDSSIRAVDAVPGLNYCGVDFILEDPSRSIHEQTAGICELNAQAASGTAEYPLFGTPRPVPRKTVEACIRMFDLDVSPPKDMESVALRLRIRGRVTNVGYRDWFVRWALRFGVVGRVYNSGRRSVQVEMMGPVEAVASLSAAAMVGPRKARPTSVVTEHIAPLKATTFERLSSAPRWWNVG